MNKSIFKSFKIQLFKFNNLVKNNSKIYLKRKYLKKNVQIF